MPHRKSSSRYEVAYRTLLDRSRILPPETSPEDLKIRTLQHATLFLHTQIQETQEYTEQLRRCLADRDAQFGERQNYQRERWRTDRRLATLKLLMDSARFPCRIIPKNSQDEITSSPAREQTNLSSFFQRGSRKAPLRFNCIVTGQALEKRVLKQVSPLLLKPSTPSTRVQSLSVPNSLAPLYARRKQSEKMINTTSTRGLWGSSSATEGTSTSDLSPKAFPDDSVGSTHNGIALILSTTLRSEEEIIAEMGNVPLPAYALSLLEDLDYIRDKFPLLPESLSHRGSPSPLLVTPADFEYQSLDSSIVSPRRTATIRIPDRHLADALLTSPESDNTPRKRRRTHKVSLDPAFLKDDSGSDKLGEVAPTRQSVQALREEETRKPRGLLRKKSSAVFSVVSRASDRRGETTPSTPRKDIASMVKKRMSVINRFR